VFEYARDVIQKADRIAHAADLESVLEELRTIPLTDFGELLFNMPDAQFPYLSKVLPAMATTEIQNSWTGCSGHPLLCQTINIVKELDHAFLRITGTQLREKRILDFGCGYGRIARLMYYYTSPANYYGVDPWELSINLCREARLPGNIALSDYLPESLPVGETRFDLIYAFSVFTHLSQRAANTALSTLKKYLKPSGLLVITIRPIEYWSTFVSSEAAPWAQRLVAAHREHGFAFAPHSRAAVDGDITYGDTSMTIRYLQESRPDWLVIGYDRSPEDIYQVLVFMRPKS
jgi:SAM-dependent methyltransferase